MTIFKKPKNGEALRNENIVIGHFQNMAIVRNEEGNLFYLFGTPEHVELGTVVENEYICPLSRLSLPEQRMIKELFAPED